MLFSDLLFMTGQERPSPFVELKIVNHRLFLRRRTKRSKLFQSRKSKFEIVRRIVHIEYKQQHPVFRCPAPENLDVFLVFLRFDFIKNPARSDSGRSQAMLQLTAERFTLTERNDRHVAWVPKRSVICPGVIS